MSTMVEQVSGLARDYQSFIRAVEAERDKFIQKCFDQNSKIETLSKRVYLAEDKLLHRNVFAKQVVKNLKLVSKERDSLAARIKSIESEKANCKGEHESFSNAALANNNKDEQTAKSQIPRSKECFLFERKLKNTVSRYKVLPPLGSANKTSLSATLAPKPPTTLAPKPPSLPPPVKRRTTKYSVPFTDKQIVKSAGENGKLNPFKVLPPVVGKPPLSKIKNCVRRPGVQPRRRE